VAAGIEHEQADWLRLAYAGTAAEPPARIVDPGRPTPNQRALSVAIGVAWCRLGRLRGATADGYQARAVAFYGTLAACGHQAVTSAGYGDEQGAPAPHDALWWYWRATMLREARLQGSSSLYVLAIQEAAEEIALCRAFWTPAGVRMPGSRAKQSPGLPFRPHWSTCSWAYALIDGAPMADLDKPDPGPAAILNDCRLAFLAIRAKARFPKLHIPVRKWELPYGGFLAALDHDESMNDRLSWVSVDVRGAIMGASDTLGDLPAPDRAPDLVVGGESSAAPGLPPDPEPARPPRPAAGDAVARADFAQRLAALRLGKRDQDARIELLRQLDGEMTPDQVRAVADRIAGFGIGDGQAQAPAWRRLVDDMRAARQ